ncbi:phosphatase PAP2 family protein [Streptomyces sp. NPDC089919]|uniref:phosphatase PAP2 family protein n=1 Tax=Streptomyces sp. NPDC089919 TaxID=3155188 RepID=UPI003445FDEF
MSRPPDRTAVRWAGPLALGAAVAFGLLAFAAAGHAGAPLPGDRWAHDWALHHRPGWALAAARLLTATGTGVIPYLLAALAGLIAARTQRERRSAVALCLLVLGLGQLLRYTLMLSLSRPRPPAADWATPYASGFSFPSGHASTGVLTAGLLVLAVWRRGPRHRLPLAAGIALWGLAVGLTRVYLGVHWPTDVLGGWLFATAWLAGCVWLWGRLVPPAPRGAHEGP